MRSRLVGGAGLLAAAVGVLPWIVDGGYGLGLVNLIFINAIAIVGLNVVWGWAGQMALSQAGFMAIGAFAVAVLATRFSVSFWVAMAAGVAAAALLAW